MIRSIKLTPILLAAAIFASPISAADAEAPEATPDGIVVALLDGGFALEHEIFAPTDSVGALTEASVAELAETLEASIPLGSAPDDGFYVSSRVPFAYNYADSSLDVSGNASNGTAAASIILEEVPEAQLLAMKVASSYGAVREEVLAAAVRDSLELGADVICLVLDDRLGQSLGDELTSALAEAKAAGVPVVVPAGDVRDLGEESIYNREASIVAPTVAQVDRTSLPASAELESVIAVGSAAGNIYEVDCFSLGETQIPYGDSNAMYTLPSGGKSFAEFFDGQELEYVLVPRFGRAQDYPAELDLTGKLALIERGDNTFVEKCQLAAERGAVGVIIIDNQPGRYEALRVLMELSEAPIPAVIVQPSDGLALKNAENKVISVKSGEKFVAEFHPSPTLSSFSAVGTTVDLRLAPQVTALGEAVEAADSTLLELGLEGESEYGSFSSTSLAAARFAGILANAKARLEPFYSGVELAEKATALATSSAELVLGVDGKTPDSPREQGSGVASSEAVKSALVMLESASGTAIELGEFVGRYLELEFTLTNLTDEPQLCELFAIVGSDGYRTHPISSLENPETPLVLSEALGKSPEDEVSFIASYTPFTSARVRYGDGQKELNSFAEEHEPFRFTLKPGKSRELRLAVTLDEKTYDEYREIFTDGFFVEGFVCARVGESTAQIPFVGFNGDFGSAEAVDADVYSGLSPLYAESRLYREYDDGRISGEITLGVDPFAADDAPDRDELYLSMTADPTRSEAWLRLALFRDILDARVEVYDGEELIASTELGRLSRTYCEYSTNMPTSVEIPLWDGRAGDNSYYIYPDGEYLVKLCYRLPGGEVERSLEWTLILDSTPPEIEVTSQTPSELHIEASDDRALSGVTVSDFMGLEATRLENGGYDAGELQGDYIYVEAVDAALNSRIIRLNKPA